MTSQFSASTPTISSGTIAQMGGLVKALQDAQLENGELKQQIAALQDKIAALEASRPRRGKKSNTTSQEGEADDNRVSRIAKQFTIMHHLWVPDEIFPVLRPPKPSTDPSYFGAREKWTLAIAAELYEVFPEDMHGTLRLASTGSEFRLAMGAQRQAMAHTLRNCAANIFASIGVPSQVFESKESRRTSPELKALLKPSKNGLYPSLPPLLYPPGNSTDIFQNPILPLILRVALFGKTSLSSTPAANSSGRKWAVTEVTTGSICLSATIARFLASPDSELSPIGAQTKINYEQDFHDYYGLIESTKNSRKGRQLRAFFQQIVFKEVPRAKQNSGDGDEDSDQDDASEFARIKAAMLETSDNEDVDNDNEDEDEDDDSGAQHRIGTAHSHRHIPSFEPPSSPSPTPSPPLSYITAISPFPQSAHTSNYDAIGQAAHQDDMGHPSKQGQRLAFEQDTPQTTYSASRNEPMMVEVATLKGKGRGRGGNKPRGKAAVAASVRDEQPRRTSQRVFTDNISYISNSLLTLASSFPTITRAIGLTKPLPHLAPSPTLSLPNSPTIALKALEESTPKHDDIAAHSVSRSLTQHDSFFGVLTTLSSSMRSTLTVSMSAVNSMSTATLGTPMLSSSSVNPNLPSSVPTPTPAPPPDSQMPSGLALALAQSDDL
ncbi:hypothetical protein PC9H_009754 [Pleurotus ostreatus]|uniref:Uncharacterized protein n=1 Tax=Pleurotus ostreatus TaxID=5322 RepID=A0A8H6ZQB2_PLEOS|nr:uncharacterized protein PC9H_009754 [Pleurotus ostreatus]KAF7424447.1 hypothetical protein PC9H_009754 [Pleurotus ostreatus]